MGIGYPLNIWLNSFEYQVLENRSQTRRELKNKFQIRPKP